MRFILMVKASEYSEAGLSQSKEYKKAMMTYKKILTEAEVLLAAEEIQPSSTGMRFTHSTRGGEPEFKAGPFPVEEALIAAFFIIDAETENEALNWAARIPVLRDSGETLIELRRMEETSHADNKPILHALEADLLQQLTILKKGE